MSDYWKKKLEELNQSLASSDPNNSYWQSKTTALDEYNRKKKYEEHVAPISAKVRANALLKEEEEKKWYEKGLFEDGYDFGDVTKTILGISDKKELKTFTAPETTMSLEELKKKQEYLSGKTWRTADESSELLNVTQQYNQKALYDYSQVLSKTKMDGQNHTVLEEIEILANMKSGKEKDERKDAVLKKMESLGMDTAFYSHFAGDGEFDWNNFGKWLSNASMAGLNSFNKAVLDTADVLLGAPLKAMGWENNPISKGAEYYTDLQSSYRYNANLYAEKLGGDAWNFGTDAVEGTLGALPNALLLFMTGGTSATATTSSLMNNAAMQTGDILTKAGLTTSTMMKNPQYWMSFARTLGSDYKEAKELGASDTAAAVGSVLKSLVNSGIEIGFDGGSGIQGLPGDLKDGGKPFWDWVESSIEEGGEEVLQKFVGEVINKAGYGSDEEMLNPIEYAKEGAFGVISGAALGGGQTALQSGINTFNEHQANKLTDMEQSVKDKIVEKRIAEKEKDGKKLTAKEKANIEEEVDRNLRKGYLSAEDIEEAIGGESYETFKAEKDKFFGSDEYQNYKKAEKDNSKRISKMEKQLQELGEQPNTVANAKKYEATQNRIDLLKKRNQQMYDNLLPEANRIMGLRSQMRSQMMETVKDSRLAETYRELGRKGQKFEIDVNQYTNENAKKTVQSILDSGLGDNSNQFHETVDWLAKLSEDRNVTFDLTKTERLKGTEHYREGYVTNGFKTKNGDLTNITINLDGKYLNTTVGHEITHVLEEAGVYEELSKAVREFAIAKEGQEAYDARIADIKEIYGDDQTAIDSELTADIIGEYLFTDYNFVHNLSTQNRNVFQKVYDEIKYMVKIATAGSKEARELEKVKKMFDKAWKENVKGKAVTEDSSATQADTSNEQYSMTKAEKAKMDEDYFAAIESGDEEVQNHLVREFAKASMPDSKLVDENGNLRMVYHGTNTGDFTVFNPDYVGMSSGDSGFFGMGFYFAYSKGEASYYGAKRIIPAYLNLTNPFNFQRELHSYNGKEARYGHAPDAVALMNFADKFPDIAMHITMGAVKNGESSRKKISVFEFAKAFKDIIENKEFDYQELVNEYGETETLVTADPQVHEYEYNGETDSWTEYGFEKRFMYEHDILDVAYEYLSNSVYSYIDIPRFTNIILDNNREFTDELKNRGYDGAIQSDYGDEAVAFYPSQIKSAEAITRDADGNVIPLSKRFDSKNDDIRYSMTKDTAGKELTDAQREFFKDSKVVDEEGNLKVMYHGTERGLGFTVFDPDYSDDGLSLFFTDSNAVAKGYSGTYSNYAPMHYESVDEVNAKIQENPFNYKYRVEEENGEYVLYFEDETIDTADTLDDIYKIFEEGYTDEAYSGNYQVYLNLKNPLVIEADGRDWENVAEEFSLELYEHLRDDFTEEEKAALIDLADTGDFDVFSKEISRATRDAGKSTADERTKLLDSAYWTYSSMQALFDMASKNFSDEAIKQASVVPMTTRDYAKKAKAEGYDGVIFKDLYDNGVYASSRDSRYPSTVAIAFDSNQVKSVRNTEPTADPDIRFSISKVVEEDKDLIALHNLTEDKLMKSLALGGLPMPSLAVTKADIPHSNFGEITLIFGKETIDPKANKKNKVYSADAWTPVFPRTEYEADSKVSNAISWKLRDLGTKVDDYFQRELNNVSHGFEDYLNRYGGEEGLIQRVMDNYGMKAAYLEEIGKHIEKVTKLEEEKKNYNPANTEKYHKIMDILGVTTAEEIGSVSLKEARDNHGAELEAVFPGITASALRMSKVFGIVKSYLETKDSGPVYNTVTDASATQMLVDEALDAEGYEAWVRNLFSGIVKDSGIYNNKPLFTPSGNRRTFKQTHLPVTLENIVKAMATQNDGKSKNVSGFNGVKTLRAATAETFKSVDQIRQRKGRLQNLTQEQFESVTEELQSRLYNVIETIDNENGQRGDRNSLFRFDTIGEILTEIGESGKYTAEDIKKSFKQYSKEVSDTTATEVSQLLEDVAQMPVNLFEAKPERVVGFDEAKVFVIPRNADIKLKQELLSKGYSIAEYDPDVEGDRKKVVNQFEEYRFSLSPEGNKPNTSGDWHIDGRDFGVSDEFSDFAPIREDVAKNDTNAAFYVAPEAIAPEKEMPKKEAPKAQDAKTIAKQRREKSKGYTDMWADLIGDTSTWVDLPIGLAYKTRTLRRILRKVVKDANGNADIAKADAIYDALETKYDHNEALLKRESARLKETFQKLNLNHAEDEYAQMLGELRHNPDTTLTEDVVSDFLKKNKFRINEDKVNKAIEESRKLYDDLLVRVNEVLREQGFKEIPYRQGYFPHFTNPKQNWLQKILNWKPTNDEIPTSIAGLTEMFKPSRSWQSFNKQRKGDKTDYSLYQGLDTYIHGALDWIYHIEDLQERRSLENLIRYTHSEEGVKQRIDEILNGDYDADEAQNMINAVLDEANNPLGGLVRELMNRTNTLANKKSSMDRAVEDLTSRKVYSVMTNLNNRITANQVVGSLSSAMTNFIPMVQSWHQVSPWYTVRGMGDYIRSVIKDDGMVEKSDFLTNRLMEEEKLYQTGWDKVSDKAGMMMDVVDSITSQTVWRSKYLQNLREGMSERQAIKDADQFAKNLMAGRSRGNAPTIFDAKNPLVKIFTAFQLEVANQYGYMFDDVVKDSKSKARLVKGYATAFLGAYAYNALYSSLVGRDAAFDPIAIIEELMSGLLDDEEEEKDVLMDFGKNIVEEMPFVGGLLGGGRIPMSSAFPYSGYSTPIESMLNDLSNENYENIGRELLKPLYYLAMPVGGGQLKKTIEGLSMFSDEHPIAGSYTSSGKLRFPVEDTFGNKVQAALFGQYASKNARDYFDNGRSALTDEQIEEFMEFDDPIQDYWEYRDGLKGLGTIAEKADYINSLDLPISKKNMLINNLSDRKNPIDLTNYDDYSDFEEFDWATKNPEKYEFFTEIGISYKDYKNADDKTKDDYNWAFQYPQYYTLSKAVSSDILEYRSYYRGLTSLKADKDSNGKSISGSRKNKVIEYINSLDIDYGAKLVLFKSEYESDDTYNEEIFQYIRDNENLSFEEKLSILKTLGFTVSDDGTVNWD